MEAAAAVVAAVTAAVVAAAVAVVAAVVACLPHSLPQTHLLVQLLMVHPVALRLAVVCQLAGLGQVLVVMVEDQGLLLLSREQEAVRLFPLLLVPGCLLVVLAAPQQMGGAVGACGGGVFLS